MMRALVLLPLLVFGCEDETVSRYADTDAIYFMIEWNEAPIEAIFTLSFPEEGKVSGVAPCNTWSAAQTAPYPWVEIGQIASTKKTCAEVELEQRFLSAIATASAVEAHGKFLILTTEMGDMVFESN